MKIYFLINNIRPSAKRARDRERIKSGIKNLVLLIARAEKRSPIEIVREIQYYLDIRQEMRAATGYSNIHEIARAKLSDLYVGINEGQPLLPQLMLAVFNEELPDTVDVSDENRSMMEQEVISLLSHSNRKVHSMLGFDNPNFELDIAIKLSQTRTEDQIREVLITELLFEVMKEKYDYFPVHRRTGM